jgi:hypothetical protein
MNKIRQNENKRWIKKGVDDKRRANARKFVCDAIRVAAIPADSKCVRD